MKECDIAGCDAPVAATINGVRLCVAGYMDLLTVLQQAGQELRTFAGDPRRVIGEARQREPVSADLRWPAERSP